MASPNGTLMNMTHRQDSQVVSMPPAISPIEPPTPATAAHAPIARVRAGPGGKLAAMSASAFGDAHAAPTPCPTRAAMSIHGAVARPPSSEAVVNRAIPPSRVARRPSRSPARPPSSSSPP